MHYCTEVKNKKKKLCDAAKAAALDAVKAQEGDEAGELLTDDQGVAAQKSNNLRKSCTSLTDELALCNDLVKMDALLPKGGGRRKSSRRKSSRRKSSRKKSSRKKSSRKKSSRKKSSRKKSSRKR